VALAAEADENARRLRVNGMKYIRLKWNHTNPDEPVWIFSELDHAGKEVRKIECFRNGFCDVATASGSSGSAALISMPLPELSVLARDPQIRGVEITSEEFEHVWTTRKFSGPEEAL
jgi:hypothetical protein